MLNGGLTIYSEFIDAMSLLTYACMVTGSYQGMSSSQPPHAQSQ
jgi:hypothetical protein